MAETKAKATATAKKTTTKATQAAAPVEPVVEEAVVEIKKEPRTFKQDDPILCRSVCPGWLGMAGKSGLYYVWEDAGDVCEVEYGDLFAYKNKKSAYLYNPLIVVEDEELLEHPRWIDLLDFYNDCVYGRDDIEMIFSLPANVFKNKLAELPKGLKKAVAVEAAVRIERKTLDSISKIKAIDEICGTDLATMVQF